MVNPFLLSLQRRDSLSEAERHIVERLASRSRFVVAGRDMARDEDSPKESCLMLSGFSARYHILGDGRRQITAIHVAGDFVDLHSFLLSRMDHSVVALSDCTIALVPHEYLRELTETQPHFSRLLWLCTIIDAAIYRQWLVAAGRLSSVGQIASFMCEMYLRLQIVQQTEDFKFRLPISQAVLSDAMGLSVVHVNRTLQELRKQKLISWEGEQVRILDWDALRAVADFDPTYLNLDARPR